MWKFLFFYNGYRCRSRVPRPRLPVSRTRSRRASGNATPAPGWCTLGCALGRCLCGARKNKHRTQYCVRTRPSRVRTPAVKYAFAYRVRESMNYALLCALIAFKKKKKKVWNILFSSWKKKGAPSIISPHRGYLELFLCLGENSERKAPNYVLRRIIHDK